MPCPAKDKADCLARIEGRIGQANQKTTTSGSVAGGGVIRENDHDDDGAARP